MSWALAVGGFVIGSLLAPPGSRARADGEGQEVRR
jgi:hypothetical protein